MRRPRIHVEALSAGRVPLPPAEAHHLRDVLRAEVGAEAELFDDGGRTAIGPIVETGPAGVVVQVDEVIERPTPTFAWTIASALPKGPRADWMIEKLSELGTAEFVPLVTARSVVRPEGRSKVERWARLAAEAAKQSRRAGVMRIAEMLTVPQALERTTGPGWYFSTGPDVVTITEAASTKWQRRPAAESEPGRLCHGLTAFIGPEGGWTDEEIASFAGKGLTAVGLGPTILRVETAAVAAAAIIAAVVAPRVA